MKKLPPLTAIRDVVGLGIGTFGLIHSQLTGMVSLPLVVVYATALGIPGVLTAIEIITGRKRSTGEEPPEDGNSR